MAKEIEREELGSDSEEDNEKGAKQLAQLDPNNIDQRSRKLLQQQNRDTIVMQMHRQQAVVKSDSNMVAQPQQRNSKPFSKDDSIESLGNIASLVSHDSLMQKDSTSRAPSSNSTRVKRQKNKLQYLTTLQQCYEKELRKKVSASNAQVETKRKGGHVEVIKATSICNGIPFLTSEQKATSLTRYLQSNEPRIVVPKGYIISELKRRVREQGAQGCMKGSSM